MKKTQCQKLGIFTKIHGKYNELLLKCGIVLDEQMRNQELFLVDIDGGLVPFFVAEDGIRFKTDKDLLVQFEDYDDIHELKRLIACDVYLPSDVQIRDEFFAFEKYIGFAVEDKNIGKTGILNKIIRYPQNAVLEVASTEGKIFLIPFHRNIIDKIDEEQETIRVNLPKGLLDIYE
ncbi:MAG: hypothetical protein CSA05_03155 [Bacteroidia bacterium]|nr:MAG: hypothetical protein CSA05_03155 [Bacteroidia bacterium]